MNLTFLKPISPYKTFTAKTYRASETNGPPVKTSDYRLGELFDREQVMASDLLGVYLALRDHAEGWIRIAGTPLPDLPTSGIQRRGINFPDGESRLLMLDLDKWDVSAELWDIRSPESIHEVVRNMLRQEGFDFLAETQFVCLLTSGQFGEERLSCHLYFVLDAPIPIVRLREWCVALKHARKKSLFDPATQRSVQPDYIGRRKCQGFTDPVPEESRISISETGIPVLQIELLEAQILQDIQATGWPSGTSLLSAIGENWLDTVGMAGREGKGINDLCYRAAAQLVQEVGREGVTARLDEYATTMHTETWAALNLNDPYTLGERVRSDDIQTYQIPRFKQYLTSALAKPFGDDVDNLKKIVQTALEQAQKGDLSAMYERPVMDAYVRLKASHAGAYVEARAKIKKHLKGDISIAEYDKACRQRGAEGEDESGGIGGDYEFVERVLDSFEWLTDGYGEQYGGWNHVDGRYRIGSLHTDIPLALYARGLELSGGTVTPFFGKTAIQTLCGHEILNRGGMKSRFVQTDVGIRVSPVGGSYGLETETWINLGLQPSGQHLCAKIGPEGVQYAREKDCPVRWKNGPGSGALVVADNPQIKERFGTNKELQAWILTRLFDFINVTDDQQPRLLGIIFALLSGRGASPVIEFTGPPSSGKSTAADLLVDLIDPVKGGLDAGAGRTDLGSIKITDLINVTSDRYFSAFDNVSGLARPWQDALCQLATGISKDQRILYVGTFTRIHAKRPVLLTALAPVITRPDAISRTDSFSFNGHAGFRIEPTRLLEEWRQDRPFLLAGLFQLLSGALKAREGRPVGSGMEARRMWFDLADRYFYHGEQAIKQVRKERKMNLAQTALDHSEFGLAFLGYLQDHEDRSVYQIEGRLADIYEGYRSWIEKNAGNEIPLRVPDGKISTVIRPYAKGVLPESVQGFTWELSKTFNALFDVGGWNIDIKMPRTNKGRTRVMRKIQPDLIGYQEIDEL